MKNLTKGMLMTALITGMLSGATAFAAEEPQEFNLDAIVVTATRYEKKDIDTPASVEVITSEKMEQTGATNLYEAMQYAAGMSIQQYGVGGSSMGNMTSKTVIRGNGNGTLVLVNGIPLNLRGTYDLNDIPVENVERVEVVRGGGSVLYGSDATGGVINIITKAKRTNTIKVAIGNRGQQQYSGSVQTNNLGFSYKFSKWGNVNGVTDSKDWKGPENNNFDLSYKFNDKLSLAASHNESRYHYIENEDKSTSMGFTPATDAFQKIKRNNIQLTYADDGFKATAYYLDRQRDKNQTRLIFNDFYGVDDETTKNYGLDIQKSWDIKNDKFLIGADYKRELFESDALSQKFKKDGSKPGGQKSGSVTRDYSGSQHRNDYSIYAQYEKKFNDKDSLSIAGRETWTAGGPNDVNFSNFSGQVQYMHKVKDNESLYASVGQSFKMPALYQIYKTDKNGVGAENLKPQKGVHYELGWKKDITDNQKLRVALYSYRVKDNITASISSKTNEFTYTNEDLKNFGVEVEYSNVRDKGFGYNLVASLSNPKSQSIDKDLNPSGFHPDQAKLQLVAGLKYKMGKFTSNLNASYLDKRETFKWDKKQVTKYGAKPYLLTDLNFKYQPEKNIGIFLNMNNILDRRDVVYYSESSNYYTTGFSFLAGAEFKF